ncbi:MAG: hypothetical protein F4Y63_03705 [Chloroflexi bacterium]|nr:hypothetical protein [Chloroflexota bacterium]MYF79976.1 hypothetical protein [Chloroflexota bacterium]MYK61437.1 hypothetical protein [Chloroflexota bacterium]
MVTMEERMSTVEQEVSSIKATLEHLATKSDVAKLEAKLESSISELKADLTWRMFGMVVGLMVAVASVVAVVQTVFD